MGQRATVSDAQGIRVSDGSSIDWGAPSGPGIVFEVVSATGVVFIKGGSSTVANMKLNTANAPPGIGPRLSVSDGSQTRVELGNLAPNGVSPAMYGIRGNDASGVPIFDSLGLIQSANVIGSVLAGSLGPMTGSMAAISGSQANFTLSRTTNILLIATMGVIVTTVGGANSTVILATVALNCAGQGNSSNIDVKIQAESQPWQLTVPCALMLPFVKGINGGPLPAGSYTAQIYGTSGYNANLADLTLLAIALGG